MHIISSIVSYDNNARKTVSRKILKIMICDIKVNDGNFVISKPKLLFKI